MYMAWDRFRGVLIGIMGLIVLGTTWYAVEFLAAGGDVFDLVIDVIWLLLVCVVIFFVIPYTLIKYAHDRAVSKLRRGDYAGALRLLRWLQYMPLPPVDMAAMKSLQGAVLVIAGQLSEAEPLLRQSYATASTREGDVEAREIAFLSLVNLAMARREQGDYYESLRLYEEAMELHPAHSLSYLGTATTLLAQGDEPARALELLAQAHEKEQKTPREELMGIIMVSRAWALAQQGERQAAEDALKDALKAVNLEYKPRAGDIYYRAGQMMQQLGDTDAAREYFSMAREIDPRGLAARLARAALEATDGTEVQKHEKVQE
jgi:tetratricopeptide (TPR) repeat protein